MSDLINTISKDIQKHCKNIDDFNKDLINAVGLSKAHQELNDNLKKILDGIQKPFSSISSAKPGAYHPYKD